MSMTVRTSSGKSLLDESRTHKIGHRNCLKRSFLASGGVLIQSCKPTQAGTPETLAVATTRIPEHVPDHPDTVLTFLHTNDTHGHLAPFRLLAYPDPVGGMSKRAGLVRQIRQQTDHVLLVDAGDVHQGCLMADAFRGEPDIELMNELGYVAMGLGNHDLDYGWESLYRRRDAALFPILCANLVNASTGRPMLDTYALVEQNEGGIRIGFTSFAGPDWRHIVAPEQWRDVTLVDPVEAARELIPRIKREADLVVVLGHQYLKDDYTLVTSVPGIDVVIGAHEHAKLTTAVQRGGALIVEAYQWGAYLGRLDVVLSKGEVTSHNYDLIPLTVDVPSDPGIESRVDMLDSEMRRMRPGRFESIGSAAMDISDEGIRFHESELGNLVCDVLRQRAEVDLAVMPSLTVLNALFKGPLVIQDIYDALPYPNQIVHLRMTGKQIQNVLDRGASSVGAGSFIQVSGIRFRMVGGVAVDVTVGGVPLEWQREYLVASTDYQVKRSIDYRPLFAAAQDVNDIGVTVKEALIEYIRANSPIEAHTDGRIVVEADVGIGQVRRAVADTRYQANG
jgi:2',3'-cyclic-nucleotide 2'-phosphodiesterase (5'-nucleotidase family)